MREAVGPELWWNVGHELELWRRRAEGIQQRAAVLLAGLGVDGSRDPYGAVSDGQLQPDRIWQPERHRQSGGGTGRFRPVLHYRASGWPPPERRREPDLRALRHQAGEVRPGEQSGVDGGAREAALDGLQRR